MTSIYFHPDCLKHNPGPDTTYAPARLQRVMAALKTNSFTSLLWATSAPALRKDLLRAHTQFYIDRVLSSIPEGDQTLFDSDTWAVSGTAEAILASTGLVLQATNDVVAGQTSNAFCLANPGGHHAEADAALGFCFVNHIATAALYAQQTLGLSRVAVVDFDVHHGNGTQSLFWNHPDNLLISLHEENNLSGFADETGCDNNILNIQIPHDSVGAAYHRIFDQQVAPKLAAFKPDMLFVSAGFDAHAQDPLGHLCLQDADYALLGTKLAALAQALCKGRLVAVMEGGYNLNQLGPSVAAFVSGLMEKGARPWPTAN